MNMSRLRNLPKDLLIEILENVEDSTRLTDEELMKRINRDKQELKFRNEKRTAEKNKHIREILLQFDLFCEIFNCRNYYENVKEYIKNGDWNFSLNYNGDLVYVGGDTSKMLDFLYFGIRGEITVADYIRDYLDEDNDKNEKKDKWNIFYSAKGVCFQKIKCKTCQSYQISNYGAENLYLFDTGYYGEDNLYEFSQLEGGFCVNCKNL